MEDLMKDIIKFSNSPYNLAIWVVPKKPDSQRNKRWRIVIDFRALNEENDKRRVPLSQYYGNIGPVRKHKIF